MVEKPTYEELKKRVGELEQIVNERNGINTRCEKSLSQLIQAMAIPTFVINRAHFVTHWNKACEKLTGISSSEMVGTQDAWKAFYPKKRPVLADLVVDCSSENQVAEYYDNFSRYELVDDAFQAQAFFPRMGDTGKSLYFTATPLMDHSERIIGAIETFQDITRRKRIEQQHRLILESIPDPVIVYDHQHGITYINEAFEGTYGWTKNELIGGIIDFVPSEEIENTKEAWRRTLSGEKVFFETKRKTKNGSLLDIQLRTAILKDKDGNHSASIVIHRDVTVIKQTEKALRESEKKFSTLFQASPVYIAFTTLDDGCFLDVNTAFTNITGYQRNEILGRTSVEIGLYFDPEERAKFIELAKHHGGFHEQEVRFRKKNGDLLLGIWSAEKIELGGKACLISVLVDVTERRKIQEALRQERDKLRAAISEIKTLSGLIPICSHCKKIRDDQGYWNQIEKYIGERSSAQFSHGICPECAKEIYPEFDLYDDDGKPI